MALLLTEEYFSPSISSPNRMIRAANFIAGWPRIQHSAAMVDQTAAKATPGHRRITQKVRPFSLSLNQAFRAARQASSTRLTPIHSAAAFQPKL